MLFDNILARLETKVSRLWHSRPRRGYSAFSGFFDLMNSISDENRRHAYFVWFFESALPNDVRLHREYFRHGGRGYGEDAFHSMWFLFFREVKPEKILEIGVYRGQTLSLFVLLQGLFVCEGIVKGLSPLRSDGDAVSTYGVLDYERDIRESYKALGLGIPNLVRGFSNSPDGIAAIRSEDWDLVYVDGSHDFDVVWGDVTNLAGSLRPGAFLVLDDASLFSGYSPPSFSFAGHPGPSRVTLNIRFQDWFEEVGSCGHNRVFRRTAIPMM